MSIPSPFSDVTPYSADRVLDSGNLTAFEYDIFQQGLAPTLLTDLQAHWLVSDHRDRVETAFAQLGNLSAESTTRPKFVLAHVMSPHPPLAFGPNGEAINGWPCFPADCDIWHTGLGQGDQVVSRITGQIRHINSMVVDATQEILANSRRPPVIILFSDHGLRHDPLDEEEMLRSLFLSLTPGHQDLFPDDVTPINVVPRLLNAYVGAAIPLAPEDSFWLDIGQLDETGPLNFARRAVTDP